MQHSTFANARQLRALAVAVFLPVLLAACTEPAPPEEQGEVLAVHCGTLIDGLGDTALNDQVVVIRDGRFAETVAATEYDAEVLDLSSKTCLPGLIDTHTHIAEPAEVGDLASFYTITEEDNLAAGIVNARLTLHAGFTTVRNLGSYVAWAARDLRDHIDSGAVVGPRMQVSGFYLTIPGGGGDLVIPGYNEEEIPRRVRMGVSQGADEFRASAQRAVEGGATVLKVIASGAVLAFGGVPGAPEMTPEEIAAVVEVAHAAGVRVTAHAHGAQSIKDAINAGVDSIEHASLADDEAIKLAAEKQIEFSMDVYNGNYIATVGRQEGWPDEFLRKNDETTEAQRQVFTKAHAAGVPITLGSDAGVFPHGLNARQFEIMVERGMTPMEAIQAASSVAATAMGWEADVGAIETGRFGDLIAVDSNPLDGVAVLQDVSVVIKGGAIVKQ